MKRVWLGILVAWVVFVGGRCALRALTPAEDRIRAALLEGCEAFSAGETGDALLLFAPEFQASPSGLDRDELWDSLRYLQLISLSRGSWPYRAGFDPETLSVELGESGDYADVAITLDLEEFTPAERTELWRLRVEGVMAETDGRWQWTVAEHSDMEGHRFR